MKNNLIIAAFFAAATVGAVQQSNAYSNNELNVLVTSNETESFKVYGNCGMCKNRIESSLKDVKGVKSAKWDVETKMLNVKFDGEQVSLKEIKEKVASAGHDTEEHKADDKVYSGLPGCCQYERETKK